MCATYFYNYLSILGVYFLLFHCDSSNLQGFFFLLLLAELKETPVGC